MGGDKFVAAVAGDDVEERLGDDLRDRWEQEVEQVIDEVQPLEGVCELLTTLKEDGWDVVLASSSIEKHFDHFAELIGAKELADGWTTKDDVEASKPEPDLVRAALEKTAADRAIMVGDSETDIRTAKAAGVPVVAVDFGYTEVPSAEFQPDRVSSLFAQLPQTVAALAH